MNGQSIEEGLRQSAAAFTHTAGLPAHMHCVGFCITRTVAGFKCEADLMASRQNSKGPNGMMGKGPGGCPGGGAPPINPFSRGFEGGPYGAPGHHMFGAPGMSPRGHHGGAHHAFGGPPHDPWSWMGDDRSGFGGMGGGMNAHGMGGGPPMGGFISLGGF